MLKLHFYAVPAVEECSRIYVLCQSRKKKVQAGNILFKFVGSMQSFFLCTRSVLVAVTAL